MEFEWDSVKANANYRLHGVTFELAQTVFRDAFAVERLDDREDYGEDRFIIIGIATGQVILLVVYTPRGERIRIILLEEQRNMKKKTTSGKTPKLLRSMSREAVEGAARADRDAQPLTLDDLARMKRTPQVKIVRRALELTQEEFADRYHIPLGTLRDWEQGRAEPDQPTRAYLTLIARDPDHVNRTLNSKS